MKKNWFNLATIILLIILGDYGFIISNYNLHPVVNNGRLVYIDTTGKIILDDDYETKFEIGQIGIEGISNKYPIYIFPEYAYFSENKVTVRRTYGFWFIRLGDEFEVIDKEGKTLIPRSERFVGRFSNQLAVIKIPLKSFDYIYDEKYTYIDTLGKYVLLAECDTNNKDLYYEPSIKNCIKTFKYSSDFSEGWAIVLTESNFNFIDLNGNYLSNIGFEDAKPFRNGLALVKVNSKWGMINQKNEMIIEPKFVDLWHFNDGFARFYDGQYYGFIDNKGGNRNNDKYKFAGDFSYGYSAVFLGESEYSYIDKQFKIATSKRFSLAGNFSDGFARVMVDGKWGYIDTKFEYFIEPQYDFATDFSEGFAYVWLENKLMIINRNRDIIWTYNFEKK